MSNRLAPHWGYQVNPGWPGIPISVEEPAPVGVPQFEISMVARLLASFAEQTNHEVEITTQIQDLQKRVGGLESLSAQAQIDVFDPGSKLSILRPIPVSFRTDGEGVIATFFNGSITTSGENHQDAFDALKDLIVHTYRVLSAVPAEKLGVGPTKKLAVLRSYIRNEDD